LPSCAKFIAAVRVPTPSRPEPKPMRAVPRRNSQTAPSGTEKMMAANAPTPKGAKRQASKTWLIPMLFVLLCTVVAVHAYVMQLLPHCW
jgi:hypothetical protein